VQRGQRPSARAWLMVWAALGTALLCARVRPAQASIAPGDQLVARVRVALRERAGADYRVVGRLEVGEVVTVVEVKGQWIRVKMAAQSGWAPAAQLSPTHSARARSNHAALARHRRDSSGTGRDGGAEIDLAMRDLHNLGDGAPKPRAAR